MLRLVLAVLVITTASPAAASTDEQGPSLEVALGVGGLTSADRPGEVTVTVTSPVLVAGRLRVRGDDIAVSRPVEVPAGSEQTYVLTVPPVQDGTRLTVEVLDGDSEPLVSETVTTRAPSGQELAVGVMGGDSLMNVLGRVRSVVTGRPVAAFPVEESVDFGELDVLDYLVVSRAGADGADTARAWARSGGRVVVDSSLATAAAEDIPAAGPEGVTRARSGAGTLVIVDRMEGRSAEEWAAILRPAPLDISGVQNRGMGNQPSLLQAASEAGSRQVPSIPWLLFAIIGFAVAVGPVNFIVLSRLGKRDWAWVTIPALALMAVAGFWVAGRQRIAGTDLTHASFITAEGNVEARSAVVVAAGVAGERVISFPPEVEVYPERSLGGGAGVELRMQGDDTASVELDQLGFTGIGVYAHDPGIPLPQLSVEEGRLTVDNPDGVAFWGWGTVSAAGSVVADGELAPGGTGEVALPREGGNNAGFGFIDALVNRHQLWNEPGRNNSLWPLSQMLMAEVDEEGVYFVGVTDDYHPEVSAPGATGDISGPTLVMVKADTAARPSGVAEATVVDTGLVNWVDWGAQRVISTDEMTVRFQTPDPSVRPRFTDSRRFGGAPVDYQAWHWERGEFVAIEPDAPLPGETVAADGEVYVRLVGENEFGDNPMSPRDLSLEWDA